MNNCFDIKGNRTLTVCCLLQATGLINCNFERLSSIADEILVGGSEEDLALISPLPDTVRISGYATGTPIHQILNRMIQQASGEWILILTSEESIAQEDLPRLAYLLTHPIRPCYELPINYYSDSAATEPGAQGHHLRLFPKDSQIHFVDGLNKLDAGNHSSISCAPFRCNVPIAHLGAVLPLSYNAQEMKLRLATVKANLHIDDWRAQQALGMEYLEQKNSAAAVAPLERANRLKPDQILLMNALAYSYMDLGNHQLALQLWQRVLVINSSFHIAYVNIAVIYMRNDRLDLAVQALSRALQIQPDHPLSHYNMGFCLTRMRQTEDAMKHYRLAFRYDTKYTAPMADLAAILIEQGSLDEAEQLLKRVLTLDPSHPVALFNLGGLYQHRGDHEQAIAAWSRWIRYYPNDPAVSRLKQIYPSLEQGR